MRPEETVVFYHDADKFQTYLDCIGVMPSGWYRQETWGTYDEHIGIVCGPCPSEDNAKKCGHIGQHEICN